VLVCDVGKEDFPRDPFRGGGLERRRGQRIITGGLDEETGAEEVVFCALAALVFKVSCSAGSGRDNVFLAVVVVAAVFIVEGRECVQRG